MRVIVCFGGQWEAADRVCAMGSGVGWWGDDSTDLASPPSSRACRGRLRASRVREGRDLAGFCGGWRAGGLVARRGAGVRDSGGVARGGDASARSNAEAHACRTADGESACRVDSPAREESDVEEGDERVGGAGRSRSPPRSPFSLSLSLSLSSGASRPATRVPSRSAAPVGADVQIDLVPLLRSSEWRMSSVCTRAGERRGARPLRPPRPRRAPRRRPRPRPLVLTR